jgi:hypothetical protein
MEHTVKNIAQLPANNVRHEVHSNNTIAILPASSLLTAAATAWNGSVACVKNEQAFSAKGK